MSTASLRAVDLWFHDLVTSLQSYQHGQIATAIVILHKWTLPTGSHSRFQQLSGVFFKQIDSVIAKIKT
jgi:hypothetical protein